MTDRERWPEVGKACDGVRWWQNAVGGFLVGALLLAMLGCLISRAAGQGILAKPPAVKKPGPAVKNAVGAPFSAAKTLPSAASLRPKGAARVDLPAWVFPRIEIPEHAGAPAAKAAERDLTGGVLLEFAQPWDGVDAEILLALGGPYRGWKSVGQVKEWWTPRPGTPPSLPMRAVMAARHPETGEVRYADVSVKVGQRRQVTFK